MADKNRTEKTISQKLHRLLGMQLIPVCALILIITAISFSAIPRSAASDIYRKITVSTTISETGRTIRTTGSIKNRSNAKFKRKVIKLHDGAVTYHRIHRSACGPAPVINKKEKK